MQNLKDATVTSLVSELKRAREIFLASAAGDPEFQEKLKNFNYARKKLITVQYNIRAAVCFGGLSVAMKAIGNAIKLAKEETAKLADIAKRLPAERIKTGIKPKYGRTRAKSRKTILQRRAARQNKGRIKRRR